MINHGQFSSEENKNIFRANGALRRLRVNPRDAVAVMEFYETCGRELQDVAVRYFGKNQLGNKAILNLLVAVVSRAWSYDPRSMNASEWLSRVADAGARSLRGALDASGSMGRPIRRAM